MAPQGHLAESPKLLVTDSQAGSNLAGARSVRVQDLLRPMLKAQVDCLAQLRAEWRKDPRFLLVGPRVVGGSAGVLSCT
jgi:hypothetical protein